jgi:hypothetical protein
VQVRAAPPRASVGTTAAECGLEGESPLRLVVRRSLRDSRELQFGVSTAFIDTVAAATPTTTAAAPATTNTATTGGITAAATTSGSSTSCACA